MKNKKTKRRGEAPYSAGNTLDRTMKDIGISLLITIGISLALLFVGTAIVYATNDPSAFVDPVGYVSLFIGCFLGGFASGKIGRRSPYLTSTVCGTLFVLTSMLLSLALPHSLASGMNLWARLGLHVLSFVTFPIGALAAVKGSAPTNRSKRKKRI